MVIDGYHHGNLRRAILEEAARMVEESGPNSLSLRELARRVGVSHAAPAHHFRDRRGLFTALATQGLNELAGIIRSSSESGFDEAAVAYVRFARERSGYYAVMYRTELLLEDDSELVNARAASRDAVLAGIESIQTSRRRALSTQEAAYTAWALVHGLASLPHRPNQDPDAEDNFVRRAAQQLFS